MTTSTAEADPGLLLSRGNWILLALLVGHTGGGRGVCHLSWSFEKAQLINYLSLACMVADLRQPCKSSRLISVLNYYKRQSSHRSRNYKTFCNRGGATYSMNWQMTRTTIWAPNTLRLPRQLANPPSPLLTTLFTLSGPSRPYPMGSWALTPLYGCHAPQTLDAWVISVNACSHGLQVPVLPENLISTCGLAPVHACF